MLLLVEFVEDSSSIDKKQKMISYEYDSHLDCRFCVATAVYDPWSSLSAVDFDCRFPGHCNLQSNWTADTNYERILIMKFRVC